MKRRISLFIKKLAVAFYRQLVEWNQQEQLRILQLQPHVFIDATVRLEAGSHIQTEGTVAEINMARNVYSRRFCTFLIAHGGRLRIAENVFFNNHCSVNCLGLVQIGANTLFGEGVRIYDHNHAYQYAPATGLQVEQKHYTVGTVIIGKNCWIGSNVTILKNVTIGDNVIVGANCLVHKSVPANSRVIHTETLAVTPYN